MSRAAWAAFVAAGLGLFLVSWSLLHRGSFASGQITDTGLYQKYGDAMAHGQVPYRDFRLEYPPGALPVFVLRRSATKATRAPTTAGSTA
jgi:hypothetical protein